MRRGHLGFRGLGLGLSCFERGMFGVGLLGLCFLDLDGWNWERLDVVPTHQPGCMVISNPRTLENCSRRDEGERDVVMTILGSYVPTLAYSSSMCPGSGHQSLFSPQTSVSRRTLLSFIQHQILPSHLFRITPQFRR